MLRTILLLCASTFAFAQVPSTWDGNCSDTIKQTVEGLRTKYNAPGIQFAISANGLMYCAGAVGYADVSTQRALTPTSLMRIGSISKTITGMAIAKLFEDGKLNLDAKAISFVPDLVPPGGFTDARWNDVTVRHMLHHTMGWDRAIGSEPAQSTVAIAANLGIRAPADTTDVIRWLLKQNLHFTPGTKESYTGVEYVFLSIIVERASGMYYERYVQEKVLEPAGVRRSMRVGRTLLEGQAYPNDPLLREAEYTTTQLPAVSASVFPYVTGTVPRPHGEWYNEALEGTGGWTANAPALLRYVHKMFGRTNIPSLFSAATLDEIRKKPVYAATDATLWYGMGWQIQQVPAGFRILFSGAIRGTSAHVMYLPNGNSYAIISNGDAEGLVEDLYAELLNKLSPLPAQQGNLLTTANYTDGAADLPVILAQKGIVNAGSYEPGVTAGSWLAVYGWKLATTTRLWTDSDFTQGNTLPTKIDGVEVLVNGIKAAVYYVSPVQINVQVPAVLTAGTATLQVIRDGIASSPEPFEIRTSSPEFIRFPIGAKNYVVAVHLSNALIADPALLPGYTAAAAGETIVIYGFGFAIAPAGQIVSSVMPVAGTVVTIGGQNAEVSFSGLVATGLFQVNLKVPQLSAGDHIVNLTVNGVPNLMTGLLSVK